jgi:glucose/arabinose dehydrogenase/type 1 glutamine amidotransferase/PKD repeat protein
VALLVFSPKKDSMNERTSTFYSYLFILIACIGFNHQLMAHSFQALVFSNSNMSSLDNAGYTAIQSLGTSHSFSVSLSQSTSDFNNTNLANYQVVIFLNRNANGFSASEKLALQQFIQGGKGFVGIHSAAAPTSGWSWFDDLIGGYVSSKTSTQSGIVKAVDGVHPASNMLPQRWTLSDAFYNLQQNPRGEAHVLLTLDKATVSGAGSVGDHPLAWVREYDSGKSFYTSLGGTNALYSNTTFLNHLLGGIEWAASAMAGDAGATIDTNFDVNTLIGPIDGCMGFDIAADGRIFYILKKGEAWVWDPTTSNSTKALDYTPAGGNHKVYTPYENGMIGIALDPQFPTRPYVYLHYTYTGSNPWGGGVGQQRVVRLSVTGNTINANSEEVLLQYDHDRDAAIHSAGCLAFDGTGNLLIATGDNTSYGSGINANSYAPIDERSGNHIYDAQRSSGNTNDLRGKILRITPSATIGGGYTVPPGNLFPSSWNTKGEIYVMGVRNPFQICVNPATGWLAWGDVGPDATSAHPLRGPIGKDEVNVATTAGNYGWPYVLGANEAYNDYDFGTATSGAKFDTLGPNNNSPNSSGLTTLPATKRAIFWEDKNRVTPEFPELGIGNATILAGDFYRFNSGSTYGFKLPQYYTNKFFVLEWTRDWVKVVSLDQSGNLLEIDPFLPTHQWQSPMAMKQGADGALYIMEWGTDRWGGSTSRISRIRYTGGSGGGSGQAPVAVLEANVDNGSTPLTVQFNGGSSYDPAAGSLNYSWNFGGTGTSSATNPSHTFWSNGVYQVTLTVTNGSGQSATRSFPVTVGNNRPVVDIIEPIEGGFYDWEDFVNFQVNVTDTEDGSTTNGTINCSNLVVQMLLGHDSHAHPSTPATSCSGSFQATAAGHVTYEDDIYYLIEAEYTDAGATNTNQLTGSAIIQINPMLRQAEHYSSASGVTVTTTGDWVSLSDVTDIDDGDWIAFSPMNLHRINSITFRAHTSGGDIEIHKGSPSGASSLVATATFNNTWSGYGEVTVPVVDPGGTDTYYFVFKNSAGTNDFMDLNWISFSGDGISIPLPVEILNFEARPLNNNAVQLDWEATPNQQLDYFKIERSTSPSGEGELVANVEPGATGSNRQYQFVDKTPFGGRSFYRLVQFDLDGSSRPTAWQEVSLETSLDEDKLKVYPNPTTGNVNVSVPVTNGYLLLEVFNTQGQRVIFHEEVVQGAGWYSKLLPTQNLAPGMYILRVKNGGKAVRAKLVVETRR